MLSDGVSALYNNYRSDDALARAEPQLRQSTRQGVAKPVTVGQWLSYSNERRSTYRRT
jgi:hypothetical protein